MKAKDYIESRLGELSSLHKNIGIRYEYNPFYSAHLIELDLTKIVSKREKKAIQKFQDIVSDDYYEKYFENGICFFEKGDLILSVSNPIYSYVADSENSMFIQLTGINKCLHVIEYIFLYILLLQMLGIFLKFLAKVILLPTTKMIIIHWQHKR